MKVGTREKVSLGAPFMSCISAGPKHTLVQPCLHGPFITGSAQVQCVLKCLRLARFQDESVLAQLGLGNCVQPCANPGQV